MGEMRTLIETMAGLHKEKFIYDFEIAEGNSLRCIETNEIFGPDEVIIEKSFRFEGDSNPGDTSVIYAITSKSGTRGILIDTYGAYSDPEIDEFISKVPQREQSNLQG